MYVSCEVGRKEGKREGRREECFICGTPCVCLTVRLIICPCLSHIQCYYGREEEAGRLIYTTASLANETSCVTLTMNLQTMYIVS